MLLTKRWVRLMGWGVWVTILAGCAGYQMGPTNGLTARAQSVFIEPFVNDTIQPRLEDDFTRAVRIGLQRDGTFRLGRKQDADIVVQGVITAYSRQGLSYDPTNLERVRDYSLVAVTQVTAYDRSTGRSILNQAVTGQTEIQAGTDLTAAERQATPLLADNMARQVVDLLVDGSW